MKLLVLSNYHDSFNSVRPEGEIFIGLQKRGWAVTVMTRTGGAFLEDFKKTGVQIIDRHPQRKIDRSVIQFIRSELRTGGYDILLLMNSKAITNGCLAAAGLPVWVVAYRGVVGGSHWLNPNAYFKHLHPRVDAIWAVSKAVQDYLQRQIWWNPEKIKHCYKGQNLAWYRGVNARSRREIGVPENAWLVACIANNRKWKGIQYLIQATAYLPADLPIHFLLIGRNMDTPDVLRGIQRSPYADRFHLMGYRNDVYELLAASQVYVQPSLHDREGLGKGILEAMSLGVPPIVTDTGGPPEFVEHGVSGMVVPPATAQPIARQIEKLFRNEPLRQRLGEGAKRVIEGKMSTENSVLCLDRLLRSELKSEK